jgi:hypothetical protein
MGTLNDPSRAEALRAAKKLYRPRGGVCSEMCKDCPFRPDGKGKAVDHEDFPRIVEYVSLGGAFYCHQTVLMDPRTTFSGRGLARHPDPPYQNHFKECFGAVAIKRGEMKPPEV